MCKWVERHRETAAERERERRLPLYDKRSREVKGGEECCYSSPFLCMEGGSSKL